MTRPDPGVEPSVGPGVGPGAHPEPAARPGVLITRPEPGAAETAWRVAALGWQPVLAPALLLAPRPFHAPPAQALLLTSRAAARAVPPSGLAPSGLAPSGLAPSGLPPSGLPVFVVGEATAAEATAQGFTQVLAAEGDAATLAALVAARLDPAKGPLLLAVGEGYGRDLAGTLRARGFRVLRRVAYAATPAAALPAPALAALHQGVIGAALFFSPRSAQSAVTLLRDTGLAATLQGVRALALSVRVAQALAPLRWAAVQVAARPDQDCLLELLGPNGQAALAEDVGKKGVGDQGVVVKA